MKFLPHFLWLIAVLAAFWVGRGSRSADNSGEQVQSSGGRSPVRSLDPVDREALSREAGFLYAKPDLGELDVERALHNAFRERDRLLRRQVVALILSGLTLDNVGAALSAFENAPPDELNDPEFQDFLRAWGRMDGEAALAYARDEDSPRRDLEFGGAAAIAGWASQDPDGAIAFVEGLEGPYSKDHLHEGIVDGLLVGDVENAMEYVLTQQLGGKEKWLIQLDHAVGTDRILGWIDRIDETASQNTLHYKDRMCIEVTKHLARFDQDRVAAWIEENAAKPFLSSWTIINARPSDRDTGRGLDWIRSLPVSDARGGALGQRLLEWSRHDANAAGEWLGTHQDDPQYDEMARSFAEEIFNKDPVSAMAWVHTIADADQRSGTGAKLLEKWRKKSPEEVAAWEESR